jgi:DNA-binding transcriptional regulator YhcF (GntR family)
MLKGDRSSQPAYESAVQAVPAAEALSFLKEIKGAATRTDRDLAKSLNISMAEVKQVLAVMELQGYVEPAGTSKKWRTTEQGDLVSGAKTPRFTREAVEQALSALRDRIQGINQDTNAPYRVTEAVAFGDFLSDRPRLQAADVGIRLAPRKSGANETETAREHAAEEAFLKELRGKTASLHIQRYEEWMSARSHRKIL